MERDLRGSPLWQEVEDHFRRWLEPGFGQPTGAGDPDVSPDGSTVAFTGSSLDALQGLPSNRVYLADVATGRVERATTGPGDDRFPRWSPDGTALAFVSDRGHPGRGRLHLLERDRLGDARPCGSVDGTIEWLSWSPDGATILLGVAGLGADLAGPQGSGTNAGSRPADLPSWAPLVEGGDDGHRWRRLWTVDVASGASRCVSPEGLNVWEGCWAGAGAALVVASHGSPEEDAWYEAELIVVDLATGAARTVLDPEDHIGLPSATPSGRTAAVVHAVCSDRGLVAGDLHVVDLAGSGVRHVDSLGADVCWTGWRDEETLTFFGLRGHEWVAGEHDLASGKTIETFVSDETAGPKYPAGSANAAGLVAVVAHSYDRPPTVALVDGADLRPVAALGDAGTDHLRSISGSMRRVSWAAPDGQSVDGFLVEPDGAGPFPLVVFVHGGPVYAWQNRWAMGSGYTNLLAGRGYAVLHPNPRGSTGKGQAFSSAVRGDMGGADAGDVLAGVDAMVAAGVADPDRLAVMGGSYGGFMSAWLVTRTDRFAAAVPMFPVTDWYSMHHTCNIAQWCALFLDDQPSNPAGRYFERSPVLHAGGVTTPCLVVAGAEDRCTPPGQAVEFHNALVAAGAASELVVYPGEGHGVRRFPGQIDLAVRLLGFLGERLAPTG